MLNRAVADNGKTEISQSMIPLTISSPGSYIFTETITGISGENGITILANNVTIDLNGFSLIGVANSINGIQSISNSINLKIINGTIKNWGRDGVDMANSKNCIFNHITSSSNTEDGLNAGFGANVSDSIFMNNGPYPHISTNDWGNGVEVEQNSTITRSISKNNNQHGIIAHSGSTVEDCSMYYNGHDGIHGSHNITVIKCVAIGNDEGIEVEASSIIMYSTVSHSIEDGIRIKRTSKGNGIVKYCTSFANGKDGIDVGTNSLVMGCNSYSNTKHGIRVETRGQVINCMATHNASSGIKLGGPGCRAENNQVSGNHEGIITSSGTTGCIIINNISDDYNIDMPGNHFEVITPTTPNLPSNPWINIEI